MLKDCRYDKIKLIYKMSKLAWFIDKHARENAKKENNDACHTACQGLLKDLERHIKIFNDLP